MQYQWEVFGALTEGRSLGCTDEKATAYNAPGVPEFKEKRQTIKREGRSGEANPVAGPARSREKFSC